MTGKQLIIELLKCNLEKEVMIQQGDDHDYSMTYSVREKELWDIDSPNDDDILDVIVIENR